MDALSSHLEVAGRRVVVLDLRPLVESPSFHTAVCTAAANVTHGAPTVVVGHSRAGAYLPGIADAVGSDELDVVFMDARLPHPNELVRVTATRTGHVAARDGGVRPAPL
ncbi:hypothetical protein [Micromonospora globbae]|uniref:hypothetical protein n=1 Tax=Micromonospora globbae TaxID=1894969 RepID=UPI003420EB83